MKKHEIRLGNIFGATGGSFAGMVYAAHALAPALNTMGGRRQTAPYRCEV